MTGPCSDTAGTGPFTDLVDEVMTQEPCASAHRVFRVVANGSSHRGQAAIDRRTARYPSTVMICTPVHASRLNQVFFSIVQRKVVSPIDFTDLDQVQDRLTGTNRKSETSSTNATISLPHWQPPDDPRGTSDTDHLAKAVHAKKGQPRTRLPRALTGPG